MIVMRHKPLAEIRRMLDGHERVLLVGCNTCAAVALAGGEKEVATLAETLRLAAAREGADAVPPAGSPPDAAVPARPLRHFTETVLQRQCEPEYVEELATAGYDAVLSLGCGAGVALIGQTLDVPVYPACDTLFIGAATGLAAWRAECSACGSCVLGTTGGICPVTRCAKGIMNGPCGGVDDGRCELGDRDCAWVLIHERMAAQSHSRAPRDFSVATCGEWHVLAEEVSR